MLQRPGQTATQLKYCAPVHQCRVRGSIAGGGVIACWRMDIHTRTLTPTEPQSHRWRWMLLAGVALVAVAGAVMLRNHLTFEALRLNREALIAFRDSHYLLAVAGFMAAYVVLVAFSLPGATIATLAGGFLFGVFPGVLYNVTAATIGASALFIAARWGVGEAVQARIANSGGAALKIQNGIRENEIPVLLLMRLVPAVPFFIANLIPALVGVSLARFAATTFVGIIPGGMVYTWVGAGLGDVFAAGSAPDLGILFKPQVLGPIAALCLLAALPIGLKFLQRNRRS